MEVPVLLERLLLCLALSFAGIKHGLLPNVFLQQAGQKGADLTFTGFFLAMAVFEE